MTDVNDRKAAAATMAAQWWTERLQSGDKEAFRENLQASILAALQAEGYCELECDYDPSGILLDAVRAAGTACRGVAFSADGILPRKHSLEVYADRLVPKEGYGNWTAEIPVR